MSNFKFYIKISFPGDLNTCKGQKHEFFDGNMVEECVASESMDYSSKPTGYYIYRQFNIHKFYVLPTQCFFFVWISEQTAIISLYSIN